MVCGGASGGLTLGGLSAWYFAVPPSLLADADSASSPIPKQATVLRQWYFASQIGTEADLEKRHRKVSRRKQFPTPC